MERNDIEIQDIIRKLRLIFKTTQAHSKFVEKECGLSGAQLWMLYEVSVTLGVRVSQLAKTLSVHPSTCSNMLDKLEEKGLVYRDRSKKDQRSVHLYVTDLGTELLTKAPSPPQGKLTEALDALSDEQLLVLNGSLANLVESLDISDKKAGFTPISSS